MGTVDSRDFVDSLILGGGRMPDDQEDAPDNPRAIRIVEYTNANDRRCWGVVFENEPQGTWNRYERETRWVRDPVVIWRLPDRLSMR